MKPQTSENGRRKAASSLKEVSAIERTRKPFIGEHERDLCVLDQGIASDKVKGQGKSTDLPKKRRRSRAKGPAQTSHTCHICTRKAKGKKCVPSLSCGNLTITSCKKRVCLVCAKKYNLAGAIAALTCDDGQLQWFCMHCSNQPCPEEAQCHYYGRANALRATKRQAVRESRTVEIEKEAAKDPESKPNKCAISYLLTESKSVEHI